MSAMSRQVSSFTKKCSGSSRQRCGRATRNSTYRTRRSTSRSIRFPSRAPEHLSHLGIQVASTDDVLATKKNWENAGLIPREEMQTTCCYALQDKAWVTDPDGNEWEVFTVIEDNLGEAKDRRCSLLHSDIHRDRRQQKGTGSRVLLTRCMSCNHDETPVVSGQIPDVLDISRDGDRRLDRIFCTPVSRHHRSISGWARQISSLPSDSS